PENAFAQFNLAVCLQQLSRWAEASLGFQKVLEIDPHRDEARLGLGACFLHLNRPEEALANFDSCWSDAARKRALFGKAVALQFLRHFQESDAAYQKLLKSDGQSEEILGNLLALSAAIRDWDAVEHYANRLLDAAPQSMAALQGLATVAL